ncbi:nucleotide-binding protein [Xanthomonas campestris pv. trichodesmae]|uniref:Nucleotide-binding protein n=2 Tax=Xanthomonas citri TaxID=346 RepID=A0AB33CHL2_XANCI|nr:nucleotide-binding protein [Xanthomonas citri]ASK93100.1 nucleotide-binding protein [Xanthomonas citri pv. vignicola]MBV6780654.1 nucleotide-binding protein [Xanthomonas campestris pv. trichodesmae]MBZ3918800.1 nucleotide-binding protein [Xanthomonas campestris pv. trichodesmae]MBZ3924221.1 nucleotide-binding protein [Xanthomonas citri pv. sesbaniae]
MIEVVRSEEDYRALLEAALDQELERARAGLTQTVASKAAARFLGVHFDTLGEWRRRSPPLGPPFQKGAGHAGGGANQHVRYLYEDLVEWQRARVSKTPKERRLVEELERLRQQARELELQLELQAVKDQVARMTRKAGRVLALTTVKECLTVPHDWVLVGGRMVGHVLTVPGDVLTAVTAADGASEANVAHTGVGSEVSEVWTATLEEALQQPWVGNEARDPFSQAMDTALGELTRHLAQERSAQRSRDLEDRLLPAIALPRTQF